MRKRLQVDPHNPLTGGRFTVNGLFHALERPLLRHEIAARLCLNLTISLSATPNCTPALNRSLGMGFDVDVFLSAVGLFPF